MTEKTLSLSSLEGNGIRLTPFRPEDISDRYITMLNDSKVNRFLEVRWTPQTRETATAFVKSFYGREEKYIWGIFVSKNNLFIGTATLYFINRSHGTAELGLMIGEESYWGKGVSDTTLSLILDYAFDVLKLRRLTGGSYDINYGMNFTYKRLGFRREGRLVKDCLLEPGGVYVDVFRWAMLDEEWRARASKR
jgi:ribosomal-protein-alanine N-acetyltransferase